MAPPFHGLIPAPHTPFGSDGELRLATVERQAAHLRRQGIGTVFVAGSTGECTSLRFDERQRLVERWAHVGREQGLRVLVHVGHNALGDAQALARQARALGTAGVAAFAPSYLKPSSAADLVDFLERIAAEAPEQPFYYYDIPGLSGVVLPLLEIAERAVARIPSFAGLKYTNPDLMLFQQCRAWGDGALEMLFGHDEMLLAGLSLGAHGAVGSTYNFCPAVSLRLLAAYEAGDLEAARREQQRTVDVVHTLSQYGYLGAAKAVMGFLGVDVGDPRPPLAALDSEARAALRLDLERMGFFDWALEPPARLAGLDAV